MPVRAFKRLLAHIRDHLYLSLPRRVSLLHEEAGPEYYQQKKAFAIKGN